ncbi:hypothetical protein DMH04_26915 [Kibdelosporangium aridum]|uniref:WXG100 family type VII secretion target n=1 Tax=Kibdelosporangium aridum TaxID=2030 RepID=A0A428Z570_KIBAR|nr:hypothetical protein [Kibdelosporangium aridum]RSM81976.1 hypothetical protein DMH04_26915 [Kibdelosporangium aridum]
MSDGNVKLDLENARGTSKALKSGAENVKGVVSDVGKELENVLWLGKAAESFREMWVNQFGGELNKQSELMRHYSAQLNDYANDQQAIMDRTVK